MITILLASFLAEVFLLSAAFKLHRYQDYLDAISSYTFLRSMPILRGRLIALAWCVPAVELIIAIALLSPPARLAASAASVVLFLSFYVLISADQRLSIVNCGCWGRTSTETSRRTLAVRNLAFVAAAGSLLIWQLFNNSHPTVAVSLAALAMAFPLSLLMLELPQFMQSISIHPSS